MDIDSNIKKLNQDLVEFVKRGDNLVIATEQDMQESSDIAKMLKQLLKKVEEDEKSFTKPLNETLKNIRSRYKPFKTSIADEIKKLQAKQQVFLTEKARKEKEEADRKRKEFEERMLEQAEQAEQAGNTEVVNQVIDAAASVRQKSVKAKSTGNVSTTYIQRSVSYSVRDLSKVPLSLLTVDDKAVKATIQDLRDKFRAEGENKGLKGDSLSDYIFEQFKNGEIPGLEFVINERVVTR